MIPKPPNDEYTKKAVDEANRLSDEEFAKIQAEREARRQAEREELRKYRQQKAPAPMAKHNDDEPEAPPPKKPVIYKPPKVRGKQRISKPEELTDEQVKANWKDLQTYMHRPHHYTRLCWDLITIHKNTNAAVVLAYLLDHEEDMMRKNKEVVKDNGFFRVLYEEMMEALNKPKSSIRDAIRDLKDIGVLEDGERIPIGKHSDKPKWLAVWRINHRKLRNLMKRIRYDLQHAENPANQAKNDEEE